MIYYGKNAIPYWYIQHLAKRSYRNSARGNPRSTRSPHELPPSFLSLYTETSDSQQNFLDKKTTRAIEHIEDLPELPFPIRRLTPGGRMYELAKDIAIGLIIWDPLDIIDD